MSLTKQEALDKIQDLKRGKKEGLTDISRSAETLLGSSNTPTTGVAPLGNIQGTLTAEKQSKALGFKVV